MSVENLIWGIASATAALVGQYFFNRWNRTSEADAFVTEKRCVHTRGNCLNVIDLKRQRLEAEVEELGRDIKIIRGILLVVATKHGISPDTLRDLTN